MGLAPVRQASSVRPVLARHGAEIEPAAYRQRLSHARKTMQKYLKAHSLTGTLITMGGQSADVLRRQEDGTWRVLIDDPWGAS